jgi:hypothetical protein
MGTAVFHLTPPGSEADSEEAAAPFIWVSSLSRPGDMCGVRRNREEGVIPERRAGNWESRTD